MNKKLNNTITVIAFCCFFIFIICCGCVNPTPKVVDNIYNIEILDATVADNKVTVELSWFNNSQEDQSFNTISSRYLIKVDNQAIECTAEEFDTVVETNHLGSVFISYNYTEKMNNNTYLTIYNNNGDIYLTKKIPYSFS